MRPRVSEAGEDAAVAAGPCPPSTPPPAAMISIMDLQQAYAVDTHPLVDVDMRIRGASYPRQDGRWDHVENLLKTYLHIQQTRERGELYYTDMMAAPSLSVL